MTEAVETNGSQPDAGIQDEVSAALEALLFTAEEPMAVIDLARVVERPAAEVEQLLQKLASDYESAGRGLSIRQVAGGWRMYTAPRTYDYVERFVLAGKSGRLSQAALETLAVVAYKQPISRQEVGDIRGVNPDGAVRTLAQRGFIEEVGRSEGPGQAILYGTTTRFLEELGIDSISDLPPLTDFLADDTPDEPALGELADVRKRLTASGQFTASREDDGDEPAADDEEHLASRRREVRREQEREMDELTASLERAARTAVAQLREAVSATEEEDEPADDTQLDDEQGDDVPAGHADPGTAT